MAAKRRDKEIPPATTKSAAVHAAPRLFRINIEVGDLESAVSFYTKLLGVERRKQAGSHFDCGPVTLQVLDVSSVGQPHHAAKGALLHGKQPGSDPRASQRSTVPLG